MYCFTILEMLNNYKKYLEFLEEKLGKFFKSQKPFIFCKAGCCHCCRHAQFPYSLLETQYLLQGAVQLPQKIQDQINKNLAETLEKKKKFKGKKFLYDCPFLINNACSVYDYRGVVCRAFGLMTFDENKKIKAPLCFDRGLNYSNVLNIKTRKISTRKYKKLNVKEEPLGFNISYKFLTNPEFEKKYQIYFGETKPLIEWFEK